MQDTVKVSTDRSRVRKTFLNRAFHSHTIQVRKALYGGWTFLKKKGAFGISFRLHLSPNGKAYLTFNPPTLTEGFRDGFIPFLETFFSFSDLSEFAVEEIHLRADIDIPMIRILSSLNAPRKKYKCIIIKKNGDTVYTLYLGSPKSDNFIRAYDKAGKEGWKDQIVTRIECVFKKKAVPIKHLGQLEELLDFDPFADLRFYRIAPEKVRSYHERAKYIGFRELIETEGLSLVKSGLGKNWKRDLAPYLEETSPPDLYAIYQKGLREWLEKGISLPPDREPEIKPSKREIFRDKITSCGGGLTLEQFLSEPEENDDWPVDCYQPIFLLQSFGDNVAVKSFGVHPGNKGIHVSVADIETGFSTVLSHAYDPSKVETEEGDEDGPIHISRTYEHLIGKQVIQLSQQRLRRVRLELEGRSTILRGMKWSERAISEPPSEHSLWYAERINTVAEKIFENRGQDNE